MAAMASRESGCVSVTGVFIIEELTQHIQFHVHSDLPSGGSLIWTASAPRFLGASEAYAHPRHAEVTLHFRASSRPSPARPGAGEPRRDPELLPESALMWPRA